MPDNVPSNLARLLSLLLIDIGHIICDGTPKNTSLQLIPGDHCSDGTNENDSLLVTIAAVDHSKSSTQVTRENSNICLFNK